MDLLPLDRGNNDSAPDLLLSPAPLGRSNGTWAASPAGRPAALPAS